MKRNQKEQGTGRIRPRHKRQPLWRQRKEEVSLSPWLPNQTKGRALTSGEKMLRHQRYYQPLKVHVLLALAIGLVGCLVSMQWWHSRRIDLQEPVTLSSKKTDLAQLSFVGDMMFSRGADLKGRHEGYDSFFKGATPIWQQSDIVVGNLETALSSPFVTKPKRWFKNPHLSSDPAALEGLSQAGVDLLGLANNHAGDNDKAGILNALELMETRGISSVGAATNLADTFHYMLYEVNGITFGVLAVTDITSMESYARENESGILTTKDDAYLGLVEEMAKETDVAIVYIHWGAEYRQQVAPRQTELGHQIVDAGADLVVGMHAHVVEPIEHYKEGLILYGLGNFIFEQEHSRTKDSVVANLIVTETGTMRLELVPMRIYQGAPSLTRHPFYKRRIIKRLTQSLHPDDVEMAVDTLVVKNFGKQFQVKED